MDTTHMEYTAEDLIAHKLQRAGLLIAKPKFDREGTDLIALMEVKDGAKFCRIQCKGRSLINSKSSSVKIPKKYTTDSFIVFLYIDDGDVNSTHLFTFFVEDIKTWKLKKEDEYILNFTKANFQTILKDKIYSSDTIDKIKFRISRANIKAEVNIILPFFQMQAYAYTSKSKNIIYEDANKEVRIEKNQLGRFDTIIKDKHSDVESIGTQCPGKPEEYNYDPTTDTWNAN